MNPQTSANELSSEQATQEAMECWYMVMTGLAGALPGNHTPEQEAYRLRELMKSLSRALREEAKEPMHAAGRAPAWVMHSYSHWWRAWLSLGKWPAAHYEEEFPFGLDFRRYLGAWLWSVGVPQLDMTPADLEAVYSMTGVAPLPHPLLPVGFSEFRQTWLRTNEVDKVPAKNLTEKALLQAFEYGKQRGVSSCEG